MVKITQQYQLDQIDKKIITLLHQDSRTSLSALAKEVGLSKDAVLYRINKSIRNKVIVKFFLDINYKAMGFSKFLLFICLKNLSPEETKKVAAAASQMPEIIFCANAIGDWDYWLEILADSTRSFDQLLEKFFNFLGQNIQHCKVMIVSDELKGYEPIIEEPSEKTKKIQGIPDLPLVKIDQSDYKILKALENNSRMPLTEIAKNTNLTLDIARYRLKKLKESRLIANFDVVVNYNTLGYSLNTIIFQLKKFTREAIRNFTSYLVNHKNVRSALRFVGHQEIMVEVLSTDKNDYLDFLNQTRTSYTDLILSYEELEIVEDIKDITVPAVKF